MKTTVSRENLFDVINFMEIKMKKNDEFFAFTYFYNKICKAEDYFTAQINIDNQDEEIVNFLDAYFKYLDGKYGITKLSINECADLLCENEKFKPSELFNIITWLKEEYRNMMTIPSSTAYVVSYKTFDGYKKLTVGYPYKNGFKKCTEINDEIIPFKDIISVLEMTNDISLLILLRFMKF